MTAQDADRIQELVISIFEHAEAVLRIAASSSGHMLRDRMEVAIANAVAELDAEVLMPLQQPRVASKHFPAPLQASTFVTPSDAIDPESPSEHD